MVLLLAAVALAKDPMLDNRSYRDTAAPIQYFETPTGVGVGIFVGGPTAGLSGPTAGLSGAYRPVDAPHFFSGGVAWSALSDQLHVHTDYVVQYYHLSDPAYPDLDFPLYVGIGARLRLGDGSWLGVRVPVGISFVYAEDPLPLDVFLELVPGLSLFPETTFTINAALGVRIYPFS